MTKKRFFLIGVGLLNAIHGLTHVIQFIQSMLLINYSMSEEVDMPWMGLVWGVIGIATMVIGLKDFRHHKTCSED